MRFMCARCARNAHLVQTPVRTSDLRRPSRLSLSEPLLCLSGHDAFDGSEAHSRLARETPAASHRHRGARGPRPSLGLKAGLSTVSSS